MIQRFVVLLLTLGGAIACAAPVIPDFVTLVKQEGATVVNISAIGIVRDSEKEPQIPGLSPDDPFYEFFRRFGPPGPREYQARSLSSGFIISEDGDFHRRVVALQIGRLAPGLCAQPLAVDVKHRTD
jgi:S1-C subfamily serine protease